MHCLAFLSITSAPILHPRRKELLFGQGDTNTRHYIVEKGLLRLYLIDPRGKEINILFARENQIIGDLATPEPTNFNLETTEDSVVYSIDELGLQSLLDHFGLKNKFDPAPSSISYRLLPWYQSRVSKQNYC